MQQYYTRKPLLLIELPNGVALLLLVGPVEPRNIARRNFVGADCSGRMTWERESSDRAMVAAALTPLVAVLRPPIRPTVRHYGRRPN
jgi:hypothetical protein